MNFPHAKYMAASDVLKLAYVIEQSGATSILVDHDFMGSLNVYVDPRGPDRWPREAWIEGSDGEMRRSATTYG